jgi:hypothetical protein
MLANEGLGEFLWVLCVGSIVCFVGLNVLFICIGGESRLVILTADISLSVIPILMVYDRVKRKKAESFKEMCYMVDTSTGKETQVFLTRKEQEDLIRSSTIST